MSQTNEETPNPGSTKAIGQGCQCPVIDNYFGKGVPGQGFWINGDCLLHGSVIRKNRKPNRTSTERK